MHKRPFAKFTDVHSKSRVYMKGDCRAQDPLLKHELSHDKGQLWKILSHTTTDFVTDVLGEGRLFWISWNTDKTSTLTTPS